MMILSVGKSEIIFREIKIYSDKLQPIQRNTAAVLFELPCTFSVQCYSITVISFTTSH